MPTKIQRFLRRLPLWRKNRVDLLGSTFEVRQAVKGEFDPQFYLSRNPDVLASGMDPLDHYLLYGWREGRDPTPFFSTNSYLLANPDVRLSGVNPFWHFIRAGMSERRTDHSVGFARPLKPQLSADHGLGEVALIIRPHFDEGFYLQKYPEVRSSGIDALLHFCSQGWKDGKDPSEWFSVQNYLAMHPDVAASGVNPFLHHICAGKEELRESKSHSASADAAASSHSLAEAGLFSGYFDADFYLLTYGDVATEGADLLEDYLEYGWRRGRDPSSAFSTNFYLESNPDVAESGVNPLWHYIVAGKNEGRLPIHPGGYRVERIRQLVKLEDEVRLWTNQSVAANLLSRFDIVAYLVNCGKDGSRTLFLSIGHDNYLSVPGGVQLCVHREEQIAIAAGHVYLYIYPWQALPRLAHLDDTGDMVVCLVLNGEGIGSCHFSDLVWAIGNAVAHFAEAQIVAHQLLGHLPEQIIELVRAAGREECWLWLHDFLTMCPSYTLQRNSVSYCAAPPVESTACRLCRFGDERATHAGRMNRLFEDLDVHVLSPSQVTVDLWKAQSRLTPASIHVLPHMSLKWRKRSKESSKTLEDKTTIGFLGTPAPHKGWNVFESLSRSLAHAGRYRFVFLGVSDGTAHGIEHRHVHVTAADPDAMIGAVREEKIDLVLHWASWPETFSFSTHEALAGGAYVVTNGVSGNVAATVASLGRGVVLRDEGDLRAFFEDGRAKALVRRLRSERQKYQVLHLLGRMVHDAIDQRASEGLR